MTALEAVIELDDAPDSLASDEARQLTDQIRKNLEVTWDLIGIAYTRRAWKALGYPSWDEYVVKEFGTQHLSVPRESREEVISSLRDFGMSLRAISEATNIGLGTVHRATKKSSTVPNGTVEPEGAEVLDEGHELSVEDGAAPLGSTTQAKPEVRTQGKNGKFYQQQNQRPTPRPSTSQERDSSVDFDQEAELGGIYPIEATEVVDRNAKARVQNIQRLTGSNGRYTQAPLPAVINLAGQIAHTTAGANELDLEEAMSLADTSSRAVLVLSQVLKTVDARFIGDAAAKVKIQANLNDAQHVIAEILDSLERC